MRQDYELDPSDELPREIVGPWVREKHERIIRYVTISHGVRQKFIGPGKAGATYVELFCGPGRARIRDTREVIDGSSVAAWKTALERKTPFSKVIVSDQSSELVDACKARLTGLGAPVKSFVGVAEETVDRVIAELNTAGLHLIVLDPYGLGALPFEIIRKLARLDRVDFLIHVSSQGLQRNLRRAILARRSGFDAFAPGWRETVGGNMLDDASIRSRFWTHWRRLILAERLTTAESAEKIRGTKNQSLYWLAFAARHERALEFWEKIRAVGGQSELF